MWYVCIYVSVYIYIYSIHEAMNRTKEWPSKRGKELSSQWPSDLCYRTCSALGPSLLGYLIDLRFANLYDCGSQHEKNNASSLSLPLLLSDTQRHKYMYVCIAIYIYYINIFIYFYLCIT